MKFYCRNCLKSPEFFDVYQYKNNNKKNRSDQGHLVLRVKAYTWHDTTEYVKNRFFSDLSKENLNINCEKDFAYLECNNSPYPSVDIKETQENFVGYKIYLNKGLKESEACLSSESQNFSDLTIESFDLMKKDHRNAS